MANHTPLFGVHLALNAKMMYFSGWEMPMHYGSQLDEHHQVRRDAGLFDISHLTRLDVSGPDARPFLRYLLSNDVATLTPGRGLYSCLLNQAAGILDDLLVYDRSDAGYRLVLNAATRSKDLAWMENQARRFQVTLQERADLALLAVQGPQAIARLETIIGVVLGVHSLARLHYVEQQDLFIARTGYTGEDGVEVMLPAARAVEFWRALLAAGVHPCGLGARDTLRLEAGMTLYGNEMDENTTPLSCGLARTIAWEPAERDFIGRAALDRQRQQGVRQVLKGLVLEGRGVLRAQQRVVAPSGATGLVTSGTFSPTLERSIGLARVPADVGDRCQVDVRHKYCPARIVQPPFVRYGQSLID